MPQSIIPLAFCITDLEEGGAERCLTELVLRLPRDEFLPRVYCLAAEPKAPRDNLSKRLTEAGVTVHYLNAQRAWHFPKTVRQLAKLWKKDRPRLVQTFLFHANFVGRWAAKMAGVRPVVSGIRVAEREQGWHLRLDRWTRSLVDRHVCVSEEVAEFSKTHNRLAPNQIVIIPNGVDVDRLSNVPAMDLGRLGLPAGKRIFVYVGRLEPQKRVDWLLETAAQWLPKQPAHDLLIVGDGPQKAFLLQLADTLGIANRVYFTGWRNDVPSILKASDALLLASQWEGMPNVVLEAMACGKPFVATEVEGLNALTPSTAREQIVGPNDRVGFCAVVCKLAADPAWAQSLGQFNQAHAKHAFSYVAMLAKYVALYRELLAPAPR